MSVAPYYVLSFYKFYKESQPQVFRDEHHLFCEQHHIKGRVYIAHEGINGTAAGTAEAVAAYQKFLHAKPQLKDMPFKIQEYTTMPFAKIKTKVRPYILNMGFKPGEDVDPSAKTGRHVSPQEWKQILENQTDYILLDIRNNYESKIGHFKGAVCPDLEGFTDFPAWADSLAEHKNKKILMYCTGGIRCEKFSALLLDKGFQDVNQLDGGILNYAHEVGADHFEGKCFVFDDRLVVDLTDKKSKPIAHCLRCQQPEDLYVNCANMDCNKLFIVCDHCAQKFEATCCDACQNSPHKRPFDLQNFRVPFRKKGIVFPELGKRQFS